MNRFLVIFCILGVSVGGSFLYAQCGSYLPPRTYNNTIYTPAVVSAPVNVYKPPTYAHTEIYTPIAVPIFIPTFSFQYAPPCVTCAHPAPQPGMPPLSGQMPQQQAIQPQMPIQQPVQPPVIQQQQPNIRELAKAIIDELQRQSPPQQQQQEVSDLPMATGPLVPPSSRPPEPPSYNRPERSSSERPSGLPPGVSPSPKKSGLSREQAAPHAIAGLQRNCAACHTGVSAKGDFLLFTQPGVINSETSWRSILREIKSGRMPPRSSQYRLTEFEKDQINNWLAGF